MADLTPEQREELERQQAKANRAFVRENSDSLDEMRAAEQALREKGIDPGTGRPL